MESVYGEKGSSIGYSESVTVKTEVSGNITGLNISTSATYTSKTNFNLKFPDTGTYSLYHRTKYSVEKGTRVVKSRSGTIISKNNYIVKKPIDGLFYLK